MKVLIAPDKFKGCLTAVEVARAMREGLLDFLHIPDDEKLHDVQSSAEGGIEPFLASNHHEIRIQPIGDGGEGTMALICQAKPECRTETVSVLDARGSPACASYSVCQRPVQSGQAFIEMASASGLAQIPEKERDPEHSTSYGTGQMILHALQNGAREIYIGLGGSATIDGGGGMLQALGFEFRVAGKPMDLQNAVVSGHGCLADVLLQIDDLTWSKEFAGLLQGTSLHIVADVESPLHGENGAIQRFAAQKGLAPKRFPLYKQALESFARICEARAPLERRPGTEEFTSAHSFSAERGAGAAGGMGFALLLLGARMHAGFEFFCLQVGMDALLDGVDLVITGEGKLDGTSLAGKGPGGIAHLARKQNIPCIAICGKAEDRSHLEESCLFADIREIGRGLSLEESMKRAAELIRQEVRGALKEGRYRGLS